MKAALLSEQEARVLAFEAFWADRARHGGAKTQAIRDEFGLTDVRYFQLLNRLLDNPAALAAEPLLVNRLRRLRDRRHRSTATA